MPVPLQSSPGNRSPQMSLNARTNGAGNGNGASAYSNVKGKRFLIIDDNVTSRGAVRRQLQQAKAQSAVPVETAEAATLFSENRPLHTMFDVILLDWFSPSVNGTQLSRLLADTYNGTDLRIFLLKDNTPPNTMSDGLRILNKPLDMNILDNYCAVPGASLWGPMPAQPVHAHVQNIAPGSPSHSFNIDSWRTSHASQVQSQRKQLSAFVPGSHVSPHAFADDEDTDPNMGRKYRHAHPHEEPHGMSFGMDHDQLSVTEKNLMFFAAFCFFAAWFACFVAYVKEVKKDDPHHLDMYVCTTGIAMMAFCAYLAKAIGQGYVTINGVTICHVRYIDWFFTTPLLMYDLCTLVGASTGTTIYIILVDLMMILFGVIAMCSVRWFHKVVWNFVAVGFFGFLMYGIFGPLTHAADQNPGAAADLFNSLKWLTVLSWSLYPLVTLQGPNGISVRVDGTVGNFGHHTEAILIVFMDLVSKILFEGLILTADI